MSTTKVKSKASTGWLIVGIVGLVFHTTASSQSFPKCDGKTELPYFTCDGIEVYSDGSNYKGNMLGGKPNGKGELNSPDGKLRIEAIFKDGQARGRGRLIDFTLRKSTEGVWAPDGSVKFSDVVRDLDPELQPSAPMRAVGSTPVATQVDDKAKLKPKVATLGFPAFPSLK